MSTTPEGAIWVKNFKLRQSVSNFISTRSIECPNCKNHFQDDLSEVQEEELNETIVNHVMTVKIRSAREKYIAIFNPRKSLSTHPDYFLYIYQADTGSPKVYPFAANPTQTTYRATYPLGQEPPGTHPITNTATNAAESPFTEDRASNQQTGASR